MELLEKRANEVLVTDDNFETQDSNSAIVSSTDSLTENSVVADDLPIYTATPKEINYWHACMNGHIQDFLSDYDLSVGSRAYNSFFIGVDENNHALTFALDDTQYMKIDLTGNNFQPIDTEQAEKVLRKVNDLRFEQNKKLSRRHEVIRKLL